MPRRRSELRSCAEEPLGDEPADPADGSRDLVGLGQKRALAVRLDLCGARRIEVGAHFGLVNTLWKCRRAKDP
jgi:hypothetical protein